MLKNLDPSRLSTHRQPTRVAVLDDYQQVAHRMVDWTRTEHTLEVTFFHDHIQDESLLLDRLRDFDVVVVMRERTPLPEKLLVRLPRLKLIVTTGMHNSTLGTSPGVLITGTAALSTPTVEMTWALILGLSRNLGREEAALRRGEWQETIGTGLSGATLGILGLGKIGSRVAEVGRAFGMNVLAWSQNLTSDAAHSAGATRVSKADLFARSDFLSVHLRLSPRSVNIIGTSELRSMKASARIINTSRAGLIDPEALSEALTNGWIAGAGLDVFDQEPIGPDHPILDLPNTLLTPHLGYVVEQNYKVFFEDALDDIDAFLQGTPVRVLNPS